MNYMILGVFMLIIFGVGIATIILLSNKRISRGIQIDSEEMDSEELARNDDVNSTETVTIMEVCFKGYSQQYIYAVNQKNIKKHQFVLVLTQDGIRCAKVVTQPHEIKVKDLPFPSFLLQTIICVADETDIEYYS